MMRRVAVILSALVLVTALTASRLSVRGTIVQGNDAFRRGNPVAAEARYEDAVRRLPGSGTATFNLGAVAYLRRQYPKASADFEQSATQLSPVTDQSKAHYNRGNALFQLGNFPEAREAFKNALRLDPSDEDARYNFVFVDRLLRSTERSRDGQTDVNPLTRDQAEQLLSSLSETALKMPRTVERSTSPTPRRPDTIDK